MASWIDLSHRWPGIAGIIWRFNKPLYGLLVSLQKRVESGSTIKAGPFEISEHFRPQDPKSQRDKAQAEIHEILEVDADSSQTTSTRSAGTLQSHYFSAEDLALRAVQAQYGVTIGRQVTAGRDQGFDGAFVLKGKLYVIEVKYTFHRINSHYLRESIQRLVSAIERYHWKNVHIIVALVYEFPEEIGKDEKNIDELRKSYSIPVEILTYNFSDLQREFGVSDKPIN